MGYENVRDYAGGLQDWKDHGEKVEPGEAPLSPVAALSPAQQDAAQREGGGRAAPPASHPAPARPSRASWLLDRIAEWSIARLLSIWLAMVVGMGVIFWLWTSVRGDGLRSAAVPLGSGFADLLSATYFSFVTALSIGYGDITPVGSLRWLAILEGGVGLLLWGAVISKMVSRRQEKLTEELHRLGFEDRLDRIRTNLHFLMADLHAIAELCAQGNAHPERALARVESAATVFAGELRDIHDLLYRPQQLPDEDVLESILAGLAATMREMTEVVACVEGARERSQTLRRTLNTVARLAGEICGDCVPREYAPDMRAWMDRIQGLAGQIA